MSKIIIRPIKLSDTKKIEELIKQLYQPVDQKSVIKSIQHHLDNDDYEIILATSSMDEVIGFISIHSTILIHREKPMARITAIIVDVNHRFLGVGKKLMNYAEAWAIKKGCNIIELTTGIFRKNSGVDIFYDKLDYKNTGDNQKIYLRKYI